ncbi:cytochrome P450 86B1 [Arachis duranensis]|uniref:Cytochrome P450 86B1 n=1 Tax=Arachis duranensis TaxID=130453 RepID=A0A6P4CL36_ARADU|nr:cytochrome P450 86B1 [Arachis duranensis]
MTTPPQMLLPLFFFKLTNNNKHMQFFHIPYHSNTKTMTKLSNLNLNLNLTTPQQDLPNGNNIFTLMQHIQMLEILLAITVFIVIHSLRQKKHYGLPIWPLLGMLPSLFFALRTNLYEWITDVLKQQNGTFRFKGPWFSSLNCIVTADPQNLEHLLKTKFSLFPKGRYFRDTVRDLLGDGIFNADDETWQKQRKTASIEFHSAKFRKLTTESLFELVHSRLLPVLESTVKENVSIDLQDILLRLTFDNVCLIAFGVDPGCLRPGLPKIPFAKAFEDATEVTVLRFVIPTCVWKAMRFLNLGMEKKLKESIKGVDEFAENVIRTRKKELSLFCDEKQRSDLLSIFMGLKDENGEAYSDKFLRDICVNFILAGRDTSSVALSWFFWLLDQNPEVEEKIVEEICRVVKQREDIDMKMKKEEFFEGLTFRPEEIKKMDYLHAALSEALRLYPSVPVDHKEVVEDDTFPDGTVLKKGTKVIYAIYSMGRMEAIWGKDCREFKPERWLRDNARFMSESAYKFTAFNGGPRLCLGKDFAYYQMKYAAASIILRYRVKVVENHPVLPKLALTMYMKHGIKVNLHKRDAEEIHKYLRG